MKVNIDKSVSAGLIIVPLVIGWGLTYYGSSVNHEPCKTIGLSMELTSGIYGFRHAFKYWNKDLSCKIEEIKEENKKLFK